MKERQLNSTTHPMPFQMISSVDHISGAYGLTPTVAISKDGGNAWAAPSGAVTELSITTPTGLTVTPTGTAGSTTYGYRVSALNGVGETLACAEVTTTTGNATLSGSNYNALSWTAVTNAATYNVYGRTGGAELKLVNQTGTTYNDTGAASPSGALPVTNSTSGGWYSLAANATDRNTLGMFILHASATTADPYDTLYQITAYDPFNATLLGTKLDISSLTSTLSSLLVRGYLVSTGTTSPVTADLYAVAGLNSNVAYYVGASTGAYVWTDGTYWYITTTVPGTTGSSYFKTASGGTAIGPYTAQGSATGTPAVAAHGNAILAAFQPEGPVAANVTQIVGNATAASNLQATSLALFTGVVSADGSATTTSFTANTTSSPGLSTTAGFYSTPPSTIAFYGGTDAPKASKITGYTVSAGVGTFTISPALPAAPSTGGTATFLIINQ